MVTKILSPYVSNTTTNVTATRTFENRQLKSVGFEPIPSGQFALTAPTGRFDILPTVTGAGNLDRIFLAIITSAGSTTAYDSLIQIWVDGVKELEADVGTFFLLHGYSSSSGNNHAFATDKLGVTYSVNTANAFVGAHRKLNVPYTGSIRVSLINGSNTTSGQIYSVCEYYDGAAPSGLYPAYQARFHSHYVPFTAVSQYNSITLLPQVTGSGVLEGIHQVMYNTTATNTFLEGNPRITSDSYNFDYTGTEDFFGGTYYWLGTPARRNEMGVAWKGQTAVGLYVYGCWRYFDQSPIVFNTGLRYAWTNGQSGQGVAPGTVNVASLVTYYTAT